MLWELTLKDGSKVFTEDLNLYRYTDYKVAEKMKCECGKPADVQDLNGDYICETCLCWKMFGQIVGT